VIIAMNSLDTQNGASETHLANLRLFLEDVTCDNLLFKHLVENDQGSSTCEIDREYYLGAPRTFADIRIGPVSGPEYFIEVKFGYTEARLLETLRRKYSIDTPQIRAAGKLLVVTSNSTKEFETQIQRIINPCLQLEVWTEATLKSQIQERLGINIDSITEHELLDVRERIENAQGCFAFGGENVAAYDNDPLRAELLWLLGPLKLKRLRETGRNSPREMLPPGRYQRVAVLMADLSSFSSFVRDTPDPEITRESLTAFCSKARYQIVNGGGMLYQFVGDAVLGFFGIPEAEPLAVANSLRVAKSILDIGASVSDNWQRQIDRIQPSNGAHIGITVGDIEILALRPFSRTRIGAFGDPINMSARLSSSVKGGQIAVSNSYYHKLPQSHQAEFEAMDELDARNVGRIKAWKLDRSCRYSNFDGC
jgi:class 3 adenylate cyclase